MVPLSTETITPQPTSDAEATHQATGNYIVITLTYAVSQLAGVSASLSISYEAVEPTAAVPVAPPDGYYPPAILFKDASGSVLLKQFLPLVAYEGNLNVGEAMLARWVLTVQNNDQFECVVLEPETNPIEATIEPPLHLCN